MFVFSILASLKRGGAAYDFGARVVGNRARLAVKGRIK